MLDGSVTLPSLTFVNDTDTGLYLISPAKIGVSTGGILRMFINTVSVTSYVPIRLQKTTNPALTFDGDTDTGIGSSGDNVLSLYTGGSVALSLDSTSAIFNMKGSILIPKGTTAERPTGANGMLRYNTTSNRFEFFENGTWINYGSGSGGTVTLTGDISGSGSSSISTTLSNTGVSAGSYSKVTVDSKGRVTYGTNPTTLDGYGITDAVTQNRQINTSGPLIGGGSLAGDLTLTMTNLGVAGTYIKVSVDNYGRVTGGQNPTTLSGYGITDAQPLNTNLSNMAALSQPGFMVRTGTGSTMATRSIAGSGNITVSNSDGTTGNPTISISANPVLSGQASMTIPKGTTAQRPVTAITGMVRYNSDLDTYEAYRTNGGWTPFIVAGQSCQSGNVYIANNAVYSFAPQTDGGVLIVSAKYLNTNYTDMVKFYTTNPPYCDNMFFKAGGNIATFSTQLYGTTGYNGCINIGVSSSTGRLYIENRTGSGQYIQYTILGV